MRERESGERGSEEEKEWRAGERGREWVRNAVSYTSLSSGRCDVLVKIR